jgi:hypothetical protein
MGKNGCPLEAAITLDEDAVWPAIATLAASRVRLEHSLSSCLHRATLFSV